MGTIPGSLSELYPSCGPVGALPTSNVVLSNTTWLPCEFANIGWTCWGIQCALDRPISTATETLFSSQLLQLKAETGEVPSKESLVRGLLGSPHVRDKNVLDAEALLDDSPGEDDQTTPA